MLGLRYIASRVPLHEVDPSLATDPLPLVARTADAFIYENPDALPRVSFASRAETADFGALIRTGRWPSTDGATVLLETPALEEPSRSVGQGPHTVRILSSSNTAVVVEAVSDTGGYIVLNDIWHPWWHARLGSRAVPVLRANAIFRAVAVPPGTHVVHFEFEPFSGLLEHLRRSLGNLALRGCHAVALCRIDG